MKHDAVLRKLMAPLSRTVLHPQWFVFKNQHKSLKDIGTLASGKILDLGAGAGVIKKYIHPENKYISLDYYETATEWYHSFPNIFGDAQYLPVKTASMDTVLILDVLEHLPCSEKAISEISRVLKPGGKVIIQIPFLYPLHDEPYDFQRWTIYGLKQLAKNGSFTVEREKSLGHPLETAALLSNLALSKSVLEWFKSKNPMLLFSPLLLLSIPFVNTIAWLLASLSTGKNEFMPHSYLIIWQKAL